MAKKSMFLSVFFMFFPFLRFIINNERKLESGVLKMKIDVPVVKNVDVLLVGGSLEGVRSALNAKTENRSVFCVTPYTYLGDDLCVHFDFQSPKSEAYRCFFGDLECATPMQIKSILERKFMESGIGFFYQTHPVEPVYDAGGNIAGLLVANRSGFQIIAAKVILDATERSLAARACGVPCKAFAPGNYRVERFVMGEAAHDSVSAIEKLPAQFKVEDRKYDVFKVSKEFFFAGNGASDFARAEVGMRRLTWTPELVAASDLCRVDLNDGVADDYCPAPSMPVVIAGRNSGEEWSQSFCWPRSPRLWWPRTPRWWKAPFRGCTARASRS